MTDLPQMLAPAQYVPIQGLAYPAEGDKTVIVGPGSPLPVSAAPKALSPIPWAPLSAVHDLTAYASAEVQVSGLSGEDALTVLRSLDNANFVAVSAVYDMNGHGPLASIAEDGIYLLPGGGWLRLDRAGEASSPVVTLRASQR